MALYVLMFTIIEQLLLNLLNQEILNTGFALLYKNEYFCHDNDKERVLTDDTRGIGDWRIIFSSSAGVAFSPFQVRSGSGRLFLCKGR